MEGKHPRKVPEYRDWIDDVSGAYVKLEDRVPTAYQELVFGLTMYTSENQGWPDVSGLCVLQKNYLRDISEQNCAAGKFVTGFCRSQGVDVVWELLVYNSNTTNPYFALRFPALIDEVIAEKGGGVRVVFDNSVVRRGDQKLGEFTTKLMEWRIKSGDLRGKEVHSFPASNEEERNLWIYVIE